MIQLYLDDITPDLKASLISLLAGAYTLSDGEVFGDITIICGKLIKDETELNPSEIEITTVEDPLEISQENEDDQPISISTEFDIPSTTDPSLTQQSDPMVSSDPSIQTGLLSIKQLNSNAKIPFSVDLDLPFNQLAVAGLVLNRPNLTASFSFNNSAFTYPLVIGEVTEDPTDILIEGTIDIYNNDGLMIDTINSSTFKLINIDSQGGSAYATLNFAPGTP